MSTNPSERERLHQGAVEALENLSNSNAPEGNPAVESDCADIVLAADACTGLRQALAGRYVSDEELDQALRA
jgi:hypothetical protein